MNYFLAKTDPETDSIDLFEGEHKTVWDGVKNPQALRAIRDMRPGDRVFSSPEGRVCRTRSPDSNGSPKPHQIKASGLNEYFGEVERDGQRFEDLQLAQQFASKVAGRLPDPRTKSQHLRR